MGVMGGGSSGSEDCSDGLDPAWGGCQFGAGAEMEGSLSDSAGSGSDAPSAGLRCAEPEPLWVGSEDEVPSVKEELVEEFEAAAVVPPPARRPRLSVS